MLSAFGFSPSYYMNRCANDVKQFNNYMVEKPSPLVRLYNTKPSMAFCIIRCMGKSIDQDCSVLRLREIKNFHYCNVIIKKSEIQVK